MTLGKITILPALLLALLAVDADTVRSADRTPLDSALLAQAPAPAPAPARAPAPAPAPARAEISVPAQHAQQNGFTACLGPLNAVTTGWAGQSPYVATSVWHNKESNRRFFNSVVALDTPASVVLITVAPAHDGLCDSISQQVSYIPQSCAALRETALRDWRPGIQANSAVSFVGPNGQVVFLMQGGPGCVVVEQRLQYGEPPAPTAAAPAGKAAAPAPAPAPAPKGK